MARRNENGRGNWTGETNLCNPQSYFALECFRQFVRAMNVRQ